MRRFFGFLAFMLMMLVVMTANIARSQDIQPTATPAVSFVSVPEAFLRVGPGLTFVTAGSLPEGSPLIPVNINEDATWVMVEFRGGFAWIRRDLATWVEDIDLLPVLETPNITPTVIPGSETPTPRLVTLTPVGNYIIASRANVLVRYGPGQSFPRIGRLQPGATIEPYALDETGNWVMIRYTLYPAQATLLPEATPEFDGFGWVAANLVYWVIDLEDLPVIYDDNLTPSPTFTTTASPTITHTPTSTETPTFTLTPTATPSDTATATATNTPSDTPTATSTPTETATLTATATTTPSYTSTPTPTSEPSPTEAVNVVQSVPTETVEPTSTPTDAPTETTEPTSTPTDAPTETVEPTSTPTDAPTETTEPTSTPTDESTAVAMVVEPPPASPNSTVPIPDDSGFPPEAIIGGVAVLAVLGYIGLYLRGVAVVGRYASGFIIDTCPVCEVGHLSVETKSDRVLGIPRAKRTVRCDNCRSVLREIGEYTWRYAVDPLGNTAIYDRYNNEPITERELIALADQPHKPVSSNPNKGTPPTFIEGSDDE